MEEGYIVKKRETDEKMCIYLRSYNVVVAEFLPNCDSAADDIKVILNENRYMAEEEE